MLILMTKENLKKNNLTMAQHTSCLLAMLAFYCCAWPFSNSRVAIDGFFLFSHNKSI